MATRVTGNTAKKRVSAVPVTEAAEPQDRIVLMVIDGIECTIQPDTPFNAVLQYMDSLLEKRFVVGQLALAKRMLAPDVYDRLIASKVTRTEWQELSNLLVNHMFGAPEKDAEQGN